MQPIEGEAELATICLFRPTSIGARFWPVK